MTTWQLPVHHMAMQMENKNVDTTRISMKNTVNPNKKGHLGRGTLGSLPGRNNVPKIGGPVCLVPIADGFYSIPY